MSKRINVVLPDSTASVLDRVAKKGTRSQFISQAVLHFVEARGKANLRQELKAGYSANAERDLQMAADWFPLEQEAHAGFESARKQKKRAKKTGT